MEVVMKRDSRGQDPQQLTIIQKNEHNMPNISKGALLEYRIKRLLFHMGYYAQTNVVIKTSPQQPNATITDLDVYGFSFAMDFSHTVKWVDCKAGNANVLQHIGWINGVKPQIAADEVLFIKQGVRKNIKEYARTLGIKIFDLDALAQIESNYNISMNDWRGSYDIATQLDKLSTFSKIAIPDSLVYKNIANFMSSSYWTLDNYSKVKKCITGIKQLSKVLPIPFTPEQTDAIKWAIYNLVSLFYLATLEICSDLYYFSDMDKSGTIAEGLISGTIPVAKRQELADISHKIAIEMIKQYIPDFKESILNRINPNIPPTYFEAYCDLVKRMTQDPISWTQGLRALDFYLMEFDLKKLPAPDDFFNMFSLRPEDVKTALKTILHFINNVTGVPKDLFNLIS